jgi:hypothetical protein
MSPSRLALGFLLLALPAAAEELPDPAPAPPALAILSDRPAPPRPAPSLPLLPGLPAPEAGAYRWVGAMPERAALQRLGAALAAVPGRVFVDVEVAGPAGDASAARRASLARALEVREGLAEGGLDPRRVDLRPLGRTAAGVDRVSVLAGGAGPGAAQPGAGPGAAQPGAGR